MVFSSFSFICIFLPAILLLYNIAPLSWKNWVLVIASSVFYLWASPIVLPLLIASCIIDYHISKRLQGEQRKYWLALGIGLNVIMLGYFKYSNFFVEQSNLLLTDVGLPPIAWTNVILPAGISFFTFEKISYLVDVFRKIVRPAGKFTDLFLFVAFFPHLIAGPILRYHDIEDQIRSRPHSAQMFFDGWTRFCIGLGKKILLADELGRSADILFQISPADLPTNYLWLAVIAYGLQLYYDFCGYSDMAIGLAGMFGFRFPENFNDPYVSRSITEFWRRWHISLSAWMREYLYIPLGGNRGSSFATYRNLVIVFFLSGLWHGASWTFVVWGLYHGFFLAIERFSLGKLLEKAPAVVSRLYFAVVVLIGWQLFRSNNMHLAFESLTGMFDLSSFAWRIPSVPAVSVMHTRGTCAFILAISIAIFPSVVPKTFRAALSGSHSLTRSVWALSLLLLSLMGLAENSFTPFLYFQF